MEEFLAEIRENQDEYKRAKQLILQFLNRKEHSSKDLFQKLKRKGISTETATQVIQEYQEKEFVNDSRFSKLLTRYQISRGKGPHWIRSKLKEKGIELSPHEMKGLFEESSEIGELNLAKDILLRKFSQYPQEQKDYSRALQMLVRRGFSYSIAKQAIETAFILEPK